MAPLINRRKFIQASAAAGLGLGALASRSALQAATQASEGEPPFKISLAQWSLHRTLGAGKLDNLDFPAFASDEFGIKAVEYVNQFFMDKARDEEYLAELGRRAADAGVESLLIMIDGEGALGDADEGQRIKTVERHYPWVEAAKSLGCHSVRVNAGSSGSYEEQKDRAADGLRRLAEFGASRDMNVIVENHGGLSSNGAWLASVIAEVDLPNCGTLPDFGNFRLGDGKEYDRYQGVAELMPYARAVSAKSYEFDDAGDEVRIDYRRMMQIVLAAGYHGHVGIEWEGGEPGEVEGIRLTQQLLERIRDEVDG